MKRARASGFTLIEILVVIVIIGVLAALLFPVIMNARVEGYKTKAIAQIRQIAQATVMYTENSNGVLPFGYESEFLRRVPLNPPLQWRHVNAPDLKSQLAPYGVKKSMWTLEAAKSDPDPLPEGTYHVGSQYIYFLGPTPLDEVPAECAIYFTAAGLHSPHQSEASNLYRSLPDTSTAFVPAAKEFKVMDDCYRRRWPDATND